MNKKTAAAKLVFVMAKAEVTVGDTGFGSIDVDKRKYQKACDKMAERLGLEAKNQGKVEFKVDDHHSTQDKNLTATAWVLTRTEAARIIKLLRGVARDD